MSFSRRQEKSQLWRGNIWCLQGRATFFRCAYAFRSALVHPHQGAITFIQPEKNDKLMEKLSGGSVCNHGHGQIVFRSSMALIVKLRTAFFSLCSLGKIDCVLKSFPFIHQGCIDYNTLQLHCKSCCCGRL